MPILQTSAGVPYPSVVRSILSGEMYPKHPIPEIQSQLAQINKSELQINQKNFIKLNDLTYNNEL